MEQITGLHHIGVYTDDIDASIAFYQDILGFKQLFFVDTDAGEKISMMEKGGLRIELVQPVSADGSAAKAARGTRNHIALACADVAACCRMLQEKGVACETAAPQMIEDFGMPPRDIVILFFRGPSGELIELYQERA